ncbi:MAG: hypothetical protein KC636_14550, partial [Myxococcales bacterium]|nr:hypothetical protein [Myxococcales bacterium]
KVAKKKAARKRSSSTERLEGPVLWSFKAGTEAAFGIYIDEHLCWVGQEAGFVYALTHDGKISRHYKLPQGVMCMVMDERWLYAGCNDGNVYDLRSERPYVAYHIDKSVQIYWMDLFQGNLAVSDDDAYLTVMDFEGERLWKKGGRGSSGWMIRCDADGLYHGHDEQVIKYDWGGKQLWKAKTRGSVLFGWQEQHAAYAGTTFGIDVIDKQSGKRLAFCELSGGVPANAASPDGRLIFAGSDDMIYAFDSKGKELWRLGTGGCGTPLSMQYFDGKLYFVTGRGFLGCMDLDKDAIADALRGEVPKPKRYTAPKQQRATTVSAKLSTATADEGVVVECFYEGSTLRVRPVSDGYDASWHVQFPRNLREDGKRFVVEELVAATQGGFYRALGKISELDE